MLIPCDYVFVYILLADGFSKTKSADFTTKTTFETALLIGKACYENNRASDIVSIYMAYTEGPRLPATLSLPPNLLSPAVFFYLIWVASTVWFLPFSTHSLYFYLGYTIIGYLPHFSLFCIVFILDDKQGTQGPQKLSYLKLELKTPWHRYWAVSFLQI